MLDEKDILFEHRLVLDTRLHLSTILRGQYSEAFFVNMCRIAYREIYYGYTNALGVKVEMAGIMDFIKNRSHGLGVTELSDFCAAMRMVAIQDRSKQQYALKFLEWLAKQHDYFQFPQEIYEFKRLIRQANALDLGVKRKKLIGRACGIIKYMYEAHPEVLSKIGFDREYTNIFQVAIAFNYQTKREAFKQLRIFKNQTTYQTQKTADFLAKALGTYHTKVLVSRLIEILKEKENRENN